MYIYHIVFICSFTNGTLGTSHVLAIVNNGAINTDGFRHFYDIRSGVMRLDHTVVVFLGIFFELPYCFLCIPPLFILSSIGSCLISLEEAVYMLHIPLRRALTEFAPSNRHVFTPSCAGVRNTQDHSKQLGIWTRVLILTKQMFLLTH